MQIKSQPMDLQETGCRHADNFEKKPFEFTKNNVRLIKNINLILHLF